MATGMDILPVAPDHIPALAALASGTFTTTFGHLYPAEDLAAFLEKSYNPDTLLAETQDPRHFWRMAWDDGRALGYLQCGPVGLPHPDADPAREGELKRIYVLKAAQGQGLGKALMEIAMAYLAERYGKAPQWIGVWSQNFKAQGLYGAYGFERAGAYQFKVGQTRDDEYILRRVPV